MSGSRSSGEAPKVEVRLVDASAAGDVLAVIRASFGARPPLDPPAEALGETLESLSAELDLDGGLLATLDGAPVGALVLAPVGTALGLRRVGVVPAAQHAGVAGELVRAAAAIARERGHDGMRVIARTELPASIAFWQHQGFTAETRDGVNVPMVKVFPRRYELATPEDTLGFGTRLAGLLRAGDLLILAGELGAGKTTFTRGLGSGLGVQGEVASPTFVIARVHPSASSGPALVHVDAYRVESLDELDDLDLDTSLDQAVTVVEWGKGMAEPLAQQRLEITLERVLAAEAADDADEWEDRDARAVDVRPVGSRWFGVDWPQMP